MKATLARLPRRRAIGLHVGDHEVALCRMAFTPLGPVEIDRQVEPREPGSPTAAIRRLIEPLRASREWRRAPIAVGMPGMGVFFSTRPVQSQRAVEDQSPQVLLHEILQSANLNVDHMVVDAIRWQPGCRPLASVAACRKKVMAPILEALEDCGVRPYQVEPGPCGLLRMAVATHRTPNRCPTALRVFLGREHALGVLTASDTPLMWRYIPIEAENEAKAILSTYRFIASSYRVYGADAAPTAVMIHGRPDLVGVDDPESWSGVPVRVSRHAGPDYEAGEIASGLALGCQSQEATFNLARHLRPPEPVLSLIPWGQLTLQAATLTAATLMMFDYRSRLEQSYAALRVEQTEFKWLQDRDAIALRKEQTDLKNRAAAIEHYLSTRILWTDCAREVAARLPGGMTITSLDANAEFTDPGKEKKSAKRSLALAVDAPIPPGGAISPEVEGLVDTLRDSPVLSESLPEISMAGLRWGASGPSKVPSASFTVLCQPGKK